MVKLIGRFVRDEEGQDLVEYAMLLAFIALIAIAGVRTLGTTVNMFFSNVATSLNAARSTPRRAVGIRWGRRFGSAPPSLQETTHRPGGHRKSHGEIH